MFWGNNYKLAQAKTRLAQVPNFSAVHAIVGSDGLILAMDPSQKRIAFIDKYNSVKTYPFSALIEVKIDQTVSSITKTNRGSQIIGAAIGNVIFGEKGFIVGGDTGSKTTQESASKISLKVYLNDLAEPLREIYFYDGSAIKIESRKFRMLATMRDEWYARIRAAIRNP